MEYFKKKTKITESTDIYSSAIYVLAFVDVYVLCVYVYIKCVYLCVCVYVFIKYICDQSTNYIQILFTDYL